MGNKTFNPNTLEVQRGLQGDKEVAYSGPYKNLYYLQDNQKDM